MYPKILTGAHIWSLYITESGFPQIQAWQFTE